MFYALIAGLLLCLLAGLTLIRCFRDNNPNSDLLISTYSITNTPTSPPTP